MSARKAVRWTNHLRRRTTSGHWLPEIDGLRFIAILSVLLFHLQGQFDHHYSLSIGPPFALAVRAFGFGNRGVQLFFAISGFILALPFARHHRFSARAPGAGSADAIAFCACSRIRTAIRPSRLRRTSSASLTRAIWPTSSIGPSFSTEPMRSTSCASSRI